ncbi:MAG: glutamine--fructose-6-phosphate transaminase (isomerizing) [Candidatus Niyogibacteria bacterium CG10_big_fil_rev_8_21_14_0_10_42_19]|uniref:Glutamine--fructose-6-phosphate aminotransferase [isomerizing] n=1 Tax=Candidatus Niyogibacteria bacterium CG10_big_fil_rev_8_21_14_0_10_42_19 TaxID=1974725 RepID=A0A2H0TGG3_9BACT|nr:MAG: glutamine--fructose-6-phosphate transaminase (isomerizing) [Candidatus Niyogibacteria bacterium CG10_big_fil_rev_8_21_14_0_10_42_19]
MCGIIGYIGKKDALKVVLNGLKRLEYRGYDSAGVAFFDNFKKIRTFKSAGKIAVLEKSIFKHNPHSSVLAIGHTRWATHGAPTKINAHPHLDCRGEIAIAHNGIIENYESLREALGREGHIFRSSTDTEVVAHLIERSFTMGARTFEDAMREALRHVKGSYAIVALSSRFPSRIVAAKNGSPILLGLGENEYIIASDASAITEYTKKVVYINDREILTISGGNYRIFDMSNRTLSRKISNIDWSVEESQKGGFSHFMLKEIHEAPKVIENALRGRVSVKSGKVKLSELDAIKNRLKQIQRVVITACGTSYFAALVGKYLMETFTGLSVEVVNASEFRYRPPVLNSSTAVIAISQSGETADTLEALREAKKMRAVTIAIVNVVGSTIAREVDAVIYNYAGPEIAVASTKAFISQLVILVLAALYLRDSVVGIIPKPDIDPLKIMRELLSLPSKAKKTLEQSDEIQKIAAKFSRFDNFLFLGRKFNWPTALEGALKLKEISYIHAEGYPAGEMKHGPIALINPKFPSIVIALKDSVYEKMISNIEETRARKGPIIAVASEEDNEIFKYSKDVMFIPKVSEELSPILAVLPLQLFAYYVAVLRGTDVDQPRNLAKSVTVE